MNCQECHPGPPEESSGFFVAPVRGDRPLPEAPPGASGMNTRRDGSFRSLGSRRWHRLAIATMRAPYGDLNDRGPVVQTIPGQVLSPARIGPAST